MELSRGERNEHKTRTSKISLQENEVNSLCNKYLLSKSRFRVLSCYIYPIFTYFSESWNLSEAMQSRIQALETWCFRRM